MSCCYCDDYSVDSDIVHLDHRRQVEMFLSAYKLTQYYDTFINEGFDRLLCLLDITESDLISLNVKRGHRRLLQRAIATAKGIPLSTPIVINYGHHYYTDWPHTPNTYNIIPLYQALKCNCTSRPITPCDKFIKVKTASLNGELEEDFYEYAMERWD
ncbi:uncharacterized protein RHIMIDRAFT_62793 [Rhizopus microsporus ATCC 52813]|uniref:SAM domain-containing protein n=1 Tax=Rhizopus microsporus ATCC 52813 TaxID=1340429 RepID=A0A2G4T672_RHIZD|nr:uncharacterized protein RHIMIDRAFT_62793 [Rhizopus microsporus ATCC 52813]PHZ16507.1 hypothetical protein RHIMIDRAFT_62793 [Rhizopus microsporus ATCC 52813]